MVVFSSWNLPPLLDGLLLDLAKCLQHVLQERSYLQVGLLCCPDFACCCPCLAHV